MSYPHKFYVYADSTLEADILSLLDKYGAEKSTLPNPANTDVLKYRCTHKDTGEIQALDKDIEALGAWLVYGRMPEAMVEFEEEPPTTEDYTNSYLLFSLGTKTSDYIETVNRTLSVSEGKINGFVVKCALDGAVNEYNTNYTLHADGNLLLEHYTFIKFENHGEYNFVCGTPLGTDHQHSFNTDGAGYSIRYYAVDIGSGPTTFTLDVNFQAPSVDQDYFEIWAIYNQIPKDARAYIKSWINLL